MATLYVASCMFYDSSNDVHCSCVSILNRNDDKGELRRYAMDHFLELYPIEDSYRGHILEVTQVWFEMIREAYLNPPGEMTHSLDDEIWVF